MNGKPTYSKQVIEIADYLFKFPQCKTAEIIAEFCGKLRKKKRTVEYLLKKAKDYNKSRIQKTEKVKDEVLATQAKEAIKRAILTREESLEILSTIAKGSARQVKRNNQLLVPTDNERTRAITVLADLQGWNAPKQSDINIKQPVIKIEVTDDAIKQELTKFMSQ